MWWIGAKRASGLQRSTWAIVASTSPSCPRRVWPDRFRAIYEAESGHRVDAWWDVHALLSYGPSWKQFLRFQNDGRAPLDVEGMTGRMEEVLERALRRL